MSFVKVYRYKIRTKDLDKVIAIEKEAEKIYYEYGLKDTARILIKDGRVTECLLLEFYDSKEQYLEVKEKVNKNKAIDRLWEEFISFVSDKKITEEEFEANTVNNKHERRQLKRRIS